MAAISLLHESFIISEPYAAGHRLTEVEAQVLNALRAENIRNNLRKQLAKLGPVPSAAALAGFHRQVAEYDRSYKFGAQRQAPPAPGDGLEIEVRRVAAERVQQYLNTAVVVPSEEAIDELMLNMMADAQVQEEARRRISIQNEAARKALQELFAPQESQS